VYFCKTHTYIVLLNRQRIENTSSGKDTVPSFQAVNHASSSNFPHGTYSTPAVPRGWTLVLASSEALLSAFMFFYHKDPAALIDWTIAQQAFNSCLILLLDAIECRMITIGAFKAEQAFVVFQDLRENNVHRLAGLAVEKISSCLQELRRIVTRPSGAQPQGQGQAAMQGVGQSEETRASCTTDTVMGYTGMFLLEDPGQQIVANEDFAPMARVIPHTSTQFGEQNHALCYRGGIYQKEAGTLKEHVGSTQSMDVMQVCVDRPRCGRRPHEMRFCPRTIACSLIVTRPQIRLPTFQCCRNTN
jgi:hypothetical protein